MDGRSVAWLSYVPIPGLALLAILARPQDRLTRYHAWQGGLLVALVFLVLLLIGFLALASEDDVYRAAVASVSGGVVLGAFVQLVWGAVGAARGRYPRLRPAWDLAAALRRGH